MWTIGNRAIKIIAFIVFLRFSTCLHAEFFDQSVEATENRIAPIGKVRISTETMLQSQRSSFHKTQNHLGKTIFESHCILCHGSGTAGAPRLGNKKDWESRIKKKLSLLLNHVKNGYRAMPPKGACLECSPTDLEAAINYMLEKSKEV
jgi:cytochrome c5